MKKLAALKLLMPFSGVEPWACLPRVLNLSQRMLFSATSIIVPVSLPASGTMMRSCLRKTLWFWRT